MDIVISCKTTQVEYTLVFCAPRPVEADAVEKRDMQEPSDAEAPKVGICFA